MDVELQRLRNYINDIQKGTKNDIRVVCRDGETRLSSALVCARSPAIKRMLNGSFKESVTKVIEFPENNLKCIEYVIKYLQYAELNTVDDIDNSFEILDFAMRYEITELVKLIGQKISYNAKLSRYAADVYVRCTDDRYKQIKEIAFTTISEYLSIPHIKFSCEKCKSTVIPIVCCSACVIPDKFHLKIKNQRCKNGHTVQANNFKCPIQPCDGKLVASPDLLNFADISDEVKLELMEKHLEYINK
ncbi:hypothetical protein PV-S19_0201 [Pacmanvirus S19]|nr:hypothetical protein PV-S19_0201 [Pacmanvirus S19]